MKEKDIINKIHKYWRAANYLTVANMYLENNKFLSREINYTDIKKFPAGHWGTCPGINFIYAHLNYYIRRYHRKTQLIIGPGHGGNALLANLELEKAINKNTVSFKASILEDEFIKINGSSIRTEVNPFVPGTIYDGGELGYSLAVAFASVMDAADTLCVCIIGDGEAETGTLSASWMCKEFLSRSSGLVLPILHLNGFKMGNRSLLSAKKDKDLRNIFYGLGYIPQIISSDFHHKMLKSLNWVEQQYREIENGHHNRLPVLILRSPKGWTIPDYKGFHMEDTLLSHKNPLRNLCSTEKIKYLENWLKSYRPKELFDKHGCPKRDVTSIIPEKKLRIGNSLSMYHKKTLKLPNSDRFYLNNQSIHEYRNISILEGFLAETIKLNRDSFRIVSPDELQSNLLGSLKQRYREEKYSDESRVLEILNENICQAWMQGYILTGRNCLMISYEAFMPIISSMISQSAKWIFQARKVAWRTNRASFSYLLTSLCWSNTYSHQNPEFINTLLSLQYDFVRIYFPIDANSLLACMETCLSTEENINLIISTKQKMPQWMNMHNAKKSVKSGTFSWNWIGKNHKIEPDIVIVAAGDYPMRECVEAIKRVSELLPDIYIRFVSVLELTSIGSNSIYPHAYNEEEFNCLFCKSSPILFCFHGYPSAIRVLLFDRLEHKRLTIFGYNNQSILSTNDLKKMVLNGCSRYNIMLKTYKLLFQNNSIDESLYQYLTDEVSTKVKRSFETDD